VEKHNRLLYNSTSVLAILSIGFLIFNMLGTLIYKQQVFFERETLASVEIVILIGFGLIFLFDIASFLWVIVRVRQSEKASIGGKATLVLGTLCLFLLIGEKAMVDEIGREYLLGWEVLGEWIILYTFLTTQLIYNIVILLQLFCAYRDIRRMTQH
jgi:hypothetical protein